MALLSSLSSEKRKKLLVGSGVSAIVFLVTLGVFASNGWLPATDALTGKKTGWFGKELPKNASSSWNPLAAPLPTATPQLSKEYIYAGSRLLAVEDANATAAPPADIAVWRPSNGNWMVMGQTGSAATTFSWGGGSLGDIPVPGDYDGDGKTDFSVFRPSDHIWYIVLSSTGAGQFPSWGNSTDIPVPADFDGDGKTDVTILRRDATSGNSVWWILRSSDNAVMTYNWGTDTDIPGAADFDGDGRADAAVYRPSTQMYYSINSSDLGLQYVPINQSGNKTVSSDYDGDGKADYAIYNPSTATWHVRQSTNGQVISTQWGAANDIPVQNDYDGDGKTDLATFNGPSSGLWTIRRSSNGTTRTESFGQTGDIPVPAFYRR